MNNILHSYNFKNVLAFLILFITAATFLNAQTPQYYNYNTSGSGNSFPLNQVPGKLVQWLVAPGEFNQPAGARSGFITNFYCYIATGYPLGPWTYTAFNLIFYQTTNSSLTNGTFYTTGGDTVYKRTSVSLQAAANTWLQFTLDHPYRYDSTKSLIIQMEQCGCPGATGYSLAHTTVSSTRRVWSTAGCPYTPYASSGTNVLNCGIDVIPIPPIPPTPPFYNYMSTEGANSFPFNIAGGKEVQWLVNPHEFNQPSMVQPGIINAVYFYMAGTASHTFSHLLIKLGLTNLTSLPPGVIFTGDLDTVFYADTVTLSSTASGWMMIPLQQFYNYDTSKSLVYDISQCGYTGSGSMTVNQHTLSPVRRCYINGTTSCVFTYAGQDGTIAHCGINIISLVGTGTINHKVPAHYSLLQNYPNPFNPSTVIRYSIPKSGNVQIRVYDEIGKEVAVLVNEYKRPGEYDVSFDGSSLSSGVYFYKIFAGDFAESKKMMLIK
jgi:hypothetical protein